MRVPQRPQKVPPGAMAAPQFGQFIFGYFLTVKAEKDYLSFFISHLSFAGKYTVN
jgi:hypothetical protein